MALQPGTRRFAPNEAGAYAVPVGAGTYQVQLAETPLYHTVTALPPVSTAFTGVSQTAPGASFALHPVPGQQDLQVFLSSSDASMDHYGVHLGLSYRNIGTVPIDSGRVVLAYDTAMTYQHSTVRADSVGLGRLTWRFGRLLPGQVRHVGSDFTLDQAPADGMVNNAATLYPLAGDLTPADNVAIAADFVESYVIDTSFVDVPRLTRQQVQAGKWLTYTARFQNPGADSVYRITVRDSLPDALRHGTLDVVNASHPFAWTFSPTGVLEIRLDGARLAGLPAGPGRAGAYVQFRVKPAVALPVGTRIAHRPRVYLDGRLALTLPEAVTVVVADPVGLAASAQTLLAGPVWPNPVAGVLHIAATLPTAGPVGVRLLDATGRTVRAIGGWRRTLARAGGDGGLARRFVPARRARGGPAFQPAACGDGGRIGRGAGATGCWPG